MTVDSASKIVLKNYPGHKIIGCRDYKNLYIFEILPIKANIEEEGPYSDMFYSVNKNSGEVKGFAPFSDIVCFMNAKLVDVSLIK